MSSIDLEIDSLSSMLDDMEKNDPFKSRVRFEYKMAIPNPRFHRGSQYRSGYFRLKIRHGQLEMSRVFLVCNFLSALIVIGSGKG